MPTHKHKFIASNVPDYELCQSCKTMHRTTNHAPDSVYEKDYWTHPNKSTLEEQIYNVSQWQGESDGMTKIEAVLRYAPPGNAALEIGCAPGCLLKELSERYEYAWGIERAESDLNFIQKTAGPKAIIAIASFPGKAERAIWNLAGELDFVCAMDVFEHVEDGTGFITEIKDILKPGGRAVLMSPLFLSDGEFDAKNYHPEHRWLYSEKYLSRWLKEYFSRVYFDRWIVGHELVIMEN